MTEDAMRRPRSLIAMAVWLVTASAFTACGGGSSPEGPADVLATRLLGAEQNDDNRDDHRCISQAVTDQFDDFTLDIMAATSSLEDLDLPSRQVLLEAALECVSAVDLGP